MAGRLIHFRAAVLLRFLSGRFQAGSLADHLGLTAAFTVEPALIVASALLLLAGLRALVSSVIP